MSKIVLSKTAYIHNLTQISSQIGSKDRIISVLKDDAYGHGTGLMARISSGSGIKWAWRKSVDGGLEIFPLFKNIIRGTYIPTGKEDDQVIYCFKWT